MDFLTKFKHDANGKPGADVKAESHLQPPSTTTQAPPARQPSPEPERDLLTKLIAGSGHHQHHRSHSRPSSSSGSTIVTTNKDRLFALTQRRAELRQQLDRLEKERTETEGYFATLRARFDAEAEWDKNEAHAADTPGEFWERFAAGKEMEKRREGLVRKEGEVRGELEGVEKERREIIEKGKSGGGEVVKGPGKGWKKA
ncbi:hypothetical protein N0V93_004512 [Gnomoniopsis smithogilvyi]|uniref:Uncharacterized protein n=1 Tax=Gnomoniopsis smithogilvyi TaxID=1191159 RepID=A0A9W8YSJ3_9PEZI|nr:hypothetical protein N0V93_004512 [Gnomoniopsis smithogilvyi]